MKKILLLSILIACCSTVVAQAPKANFALAQKFENNITKYNYDLSITPRFINKTDVFWYSFKTVNGIKFYIVDPAKNSKKELFDLKDLLGKVSSYTRKWCDETRFTLQNPKFDDKLSSFTFEHEGMKYRYTIATKKVEQLESYNFKEWGISGYIYSPDSMWMVYVKKHDLYLRGTKKNCKDTSEVRLTTDGEFYRSYAKYAEESEEIEITIPSGRWLKNSKKFVLTIEDKRDLDDMYIVDMLTQSRPKLKAYKYCCPGDKEIKQYSLAIIDIQTKEITPINVDKWKDQYVEFAYSNKKGDKIFLYRTKRTWDEKELCVYDVNTKEVKVLINEQDKPYFDYVMAQTHFINDGKEIILRSERTGYGHFYLYDGETGKLKHAITSGNYVAGQMQKLDTLKREMYFYGYGREKGFDPYYNILYKVNLDTGKLDMLTSENANHKIAFSHSFRYMVDIYSTVETVPYSVVRNSSGKVIMTLDRADIKPLLNKGWRAPERFTVKSADGVTDLYGVMWKPIDFDSTKKYPIISEVYPGPHLEYVPTSFTLKDSYASALAQVGFIVIQVGHRGGTPVRGKFYHRQSYGKMRDYALADDRAAIIQLAQRYPFININKVGIYGHSGGGFMSTAALCTYPDFYTAAVSSAGNHDNRIFNTGWVEMNNGVKEVAKKPKAGEDPADTVAFKLNPIHTNIDLAKNYKGHLLLVTGMMDDNVNPAHSFRMAKALIEAGKNFDMICLPSSNHGFSGKEKEYFIGKAWRYFAKYLLEDSSGDFQHEIGKFDNKTK